MSSKDQKSDRSLAWVLCPKCGQRFRLEWRHDEEHLPTLFVVEKGDGPMTALQIECPHCNYEEDL